MSFQIRHFVQNFFKTFSLLILSAGLFVSVIVSLFFVRLIRDLPDVKHLKQYQHSAATEVFSDDGKKIGEFSNERRYPVKFDSIPKHVVMAFLAAEDAGFYKHKGIELGGILRAILLNAMKGRFAQGASTITQQVARGLLLTKKKEISRKIREIILARRMEEELTKNEILSLYLSDIYLGHGAWGIGAAANNYFRKKVEDLTLAEGALLAGLPQRPNDWDPFHNAHMSKARQSYVLRRMVEENFITLDEAKSALATPLRLYVNEDPNTVAPFYTEDIRQYLMNKYGSERVLSQGLKVYTTLRYDFQKQAERSVDQGLRAVDKRLGWRGAVNHLNSEEVQQTFLKEAHESIVDKLTPQRILASNVPPEMKRLEPDIEEFRASTSPYFGETPLKEGDVFKGLITSVDVPEKKITVRIGRTNITIGEAGWEWVKGKEGAAKQVSDFVKVGDVIWVKVARIEKKIGLIQGVLEQEPEIQGALLSFESASGFVRAMIGGTDFNRSKFNIALQGRRQVGSACKPLLYAAAMDKGYSPSSIVTDAPIVFKYEGQLDADNTGEPWRPHNYEGRFKGDIPLRLALVRSMNIPSVKLLNEISLDYGIHFIQKMGITSPLQHDLSIALGSWSSSLEEMTRAYAIFPRLGKAVHLVYVKKVLDGQGNVLEEYKPEEDAAPKVEAANALPNVPLTPAPAIEDAELKKQGLVISPQTAYVMTDLMKAVVHDPEGTGRAASVVPGAVAGKTGTSNDYRDAWFIGFTPDVVTGAWLGYEKDRALDPSETGGKAVAPIWADYMGVVVKNYPKKDFPIPDDITFAYVNRDTGVLAGSNTTRRVRVAFKAGMVPNAAGDNIPRIGEPGVRATTNSPTPELSKDGPLPLPPAQDELNDFQRRGYQD